MKKSFLHRSCQVVFDNRSEFTKSSTISKKEKIKKVSIKFNSIKEYREIEKKLIDDGFKRDDVFSHLIEDSKCVKIYPDFTFTILEHFPMNVEKAYNSLQDFLNDIK